MIDPTPRVLLILGMHRSGTSVVTQWLHRCGLHVGENLIGHSIGNEQGHYEDRDFHDFHEDVFRSNRIPYGGFKGLSQVALNTRQQARLALLIKDKNRAHARWGWKDPRTCLFLEAYDDVLDSPSYLIVYRKASEVVDSLLRRYEDMLVRGYHRSRIMDHLTLRMKATMPWAFSTRKLERDFTTSWLRYNEHLLRLTDRAETNRFKVVQSSGLLNSSQQIVPWLNERGFELDEVPFDEVYQAGLLTSQGAGFAIPVDLLERVNEVERRLSELERQG